MAEEHGASHDEHEHKKHKSHGGHGHGGGHEEHEEGVPEWVVSFADNALLQMGFFVILLAMNLKEPTSGGVGGKDQNGKEPATPSERMVDMMIGVREAFNNPVNLDSTNPNDLPLIRRIVQRREGTAVENGPRGDKQNVESVRPTDYRRLGGLVTFEENSADVDTTGRDAAVAVAKEIKGRRSIVEVRGHVSLGEAYKPLDKGMKLSFDRALAVAQILWDSGVDRDQVRVVAVGAGDRAAPLARDQNARRNNQRAEIIITDETMPADPFAGDPAGAKGAPAPSAPAPPPVPSSAPDAQPDPQPEHEPGR